MILLKDVQKQSKDKNNPQDLLSNINIHIKQGDFIAICGENGAGKSVLANILSLNDSDFVGEYYLDRIELTKYAPKQLLQQKVSRYGFSSEFPLFALNKTTLANSIIALKNLKLPKSKKEEIIKQTFYKFNINSSILNKKMKYLSAGTLKLVSLALAFVNNPQVVVLDNPTVFLDEEIVKNFISIVASYIKQEDKIIIVLTNDDRLLCKAKRLFNINSGKVIETIKQKTKQSQDPSGAKNKKSKQTAPKIRKQIITTSAKTEEQLKQDILEDKLIVFDDTNQISFDIAQNNKTIDKKKVQDIKKEKSVNNAKKTTKKDIGAKQLSLIDDSRKKSAKKEAQDDESEMLIKPVKSGAKRRPKLNI